MDLAQQTNHKTGLQKLPFRKRVFGSWKARVFASSLMLIGAGWCGYDLYSTGVDMKKKYYAEEHALLTQGNGTPISASKKRDIIEQVYPHDTHMKNLVEFMAIISLPFFALTNLVKPNDL